jgi:hypothetical protein
MMTDEQRAAWLARTSEAWARIAPYLQEGDTITHTRCCNLIEEHFFVEIVNETDDGIATCLAGYPTSDTMRLSDRDFYIADDIATCNITHINRVPVDSLALLNREPMVRQTPEESAALDAQIDDALATIDDVPF